MLYKDLVKLGIESEDPKYPQNSKLIFFFFTLPKFSQKSNPAVNKIILDHYVMPRNRQENHETSKQTEKLPHIF